MRSAAVVAVYWAGMADKGHYQWIRRKRRFFPSTFLYVGQLVLELPGNVRNGRQVGGVSRSSHPDIHSERLARRKHAEPIGNRAARRAAI